MKIIAVIVVLLLTSLVFANTTICKVDDPKPDGIKTIAWDDNNLTANVTTFYDKRKEGKVTYRKQNVNSTNIVTLGTYTHIESATEYVIYPEHKTDMKTGDQILSNIDFDIHSATYFIIDGEYHLWHTREPQKAFCITK